MRNHSLASLRQRSSTSQVHPPRSQPRQGQQRSNLPPISNRAKPASTEPPPSEGELASIRDQLSEEYDTSSISAQTLQYLVSYLRESSLKHALDEEYDVAEKDQELSEKVRVDIKNKVVVGKPSEYLENDLRQKQEKYDDKLQNEVKKYDEDTEERRNEFFRRKEEKFQEFEKEWSYDNAEESEEPEEDGKKDGKKEHKKDNLKKYRKPSSRLLELKKIEKSQAINKEFEQAKITHKEIEQMSQREKDVSQMQLIRDYRFALGNFEKYWNDQYKVFLMARSNNREILITELQKEKGNLDQRAHVVERRKEELKIARPTTILNVRGARELPQGKSVAHQTEFLLPPLIAPTDKELIKQLRARQQQDSNKKKEHQERNSDKGSHSYDYSGGSNDKKTTNVKNSYRTTENLFGTQNMDAKANDENHDSDETFNNEGEEENGNEGGETHQGEEEDGNIGGETPNGEEENGNEGGEAPNGEEGTTNEVGEGKEVDSENPEGESKSLNVAQQLVGTFPE